MEGGRHCPLKISFNHKVHGTQDIFYVCLKKKPKKRLNVTQLNYTPCSGHKSSIFCTIRHQPEQVDFASLLGIFFGDKHKNLETLAPYSGFWADPRGILHLRIKRWYDPLLHPLPLSNSLLLSLLLQLPLSVFLSASLC